MSIQHDNDIFVNATESLGAVVAISPPVSLMARRYARLARRSNRGLA